MHDPNTIGGPQIGAIKRGQDTKPIAAEEARNLLSLFFLFPWHRSPQEVELLASRVEFDQSVRLQESIDRLERKSSRLSKILIVLTCGVTGADRGAALPSGTSCALRWQMGRPAKIHSLPDSFARRKRAAYV
jgi:hypothetical protein